MRLRGRAGVAPAVRTLGLVGLVIAVVIRSPPTEAALFPCDEIGVFDAFAAGGGPHTFDCNVPTTVTLSFATLSAPVPVTIDGEDRLTLSGGGVFVVLAVAAAGSVELRNLAITGGYNDSSDGAAGIVSYGGDLVLSGVTIADNAAGWSAASGGISVESGNLTLVDSVLTRNTGGSQLNAASAIRGRAGSSVTLQGSTIDANVGGGMVLLIEGSATIVDSTLSNNTAVLGGGLFVGPPTAGPVASALVNRSTIRGNSASFGGAGVVFAGSTLSVTNSTVSGNAASIAGGGFYLGTTSSMSLTSSTVAGNSGASGTVVTWSSGPAPTTFSNTIASGSCGVYGGGGFSATSNGGNVESPGSTCGLLHASDRVTVPPAALALGALADHGGPTETIELLETSVALEAGVGCPPPATDQRGVARPQSALCDAGAFERALPVLVPLSPIAALGLAVLLIVAAQPPFAQSRGRRKSRSRRSSADPGSGCQS